MTITLTPEKRAEQFAILESDEFKTWASDWTQHGIEIPPMSYLGPDPMVDRHICGRDGEPCREEGQKVTLEEVDERRTLVIDQFQMLSASEPQMTMNVDENLAQARDAGVEQIKAADPRLAEFWKKAALIAKMRGYCGTYNEFVVMLGGPKTEDCD